jgi:hypothetical protein
MRTFLEELELVKQRRRVFVALFGLAEEVVVVVVVVVVVIRRGGFRGLGCEIGVSGRPDLPAYSLVRRTTCLLIGNLALSANEVRNLKRQRDGN